MNLKRDRKTGLSIFGLFSLGFGAIVGVGWSATLNNLLRCGGGAVPAAAGFGLTALLLIPIALCFAELSAAIPEAGGAVAYAERAFGKRAAFWSGWFTVLSYVSLLPFEAIAVNDIFGYLFPFIRSGDALYFVFGEPVYPRSLLIGLFISLSILTVNWHGFRAGAKFQKLNTLVLLSGSIICLTFAFFKADFSNLLPLYSPVSGGNYSGLLGGILAMFSLAPGYLSGFDTIPQSVEFARNIAPRRFGKIIIIVLICAGIFYCTVFLSAGLAFPWLDIIELPRPVMSNLLYQLYPGLWGRILWFICMAATLSGLLGVWNSFFIAGARLICVMASDGLLPKIFAARHKKYDTPYIAFLLCWLITVLGSLAGSGAIKLLNAITSCGFVVSWALTCAAAAKLRKSEPALSRPYKMPFGTFLPWIGFAICMIMFFNCFLPFAPGYIGLPGVVALFCWALIGMGTFWCRGYKKR